MENAGEALQIAAAVLIFVLALSISINAFGEARQSAQIVLDYKDREYDYTYVEGENTQRIVGLESIVPAIYKAYRENYKIVFDTNLLNIRNNGLYKQKDETGDFKSIYSIDLEITDSKKGVVLGTDEQKERFIMAILYGPDQSTKTEFLNAGIQLNDKGIYDIIKENNKTFVEKLGVYYQEEVEKYSNGAPDANQNAKRVITYADS